MDLLYSVDGASQPVINILPIRSYDIICIHTNINLKWNILLLVQKNLSLMLFKHNDLSLWTKSCLLETIVVDPVTVKF